MVLDDRIRYGLRAIAVLIFKKLRLSRTKNLNKTTNCKMFINILYYSLLLIEDFAISEYVLITHVDCVDCTYDTASPIQWCMKLKNIGGRGADKEYLPYFLDWNARVLLVSSELLAGVVFEGAFYSRARSIPFSLLSY